MSSWEAVLLEPARTVIAQISQFMVNVLLVLIILLIGWILSRVLRTVITRGLRSLKLDELSDRIGLDTILAKGGIMFSLSELIGATFYWLGILVSFMVAINAVGLTVAASLLNTVVLYIPNIIAAMFILIVGIFVATLLKNIVQTAANNAGLTQGALLSKTVEVIVIAFVVLVALEQLNIGIRITELTLSIILGSIGLALALAFGLGCKDIAARFTNEFIEKMKKK
jgi:hypothetical protein